MGAGWCELRERVTRAEEARPYFSQVSDAHEVTLRRTAAASAVATRTLSRDVPSVLALLGTGPQAFACCMCIACASLVHRICRLHLQVAYVQVACAGCMCMCMAHDRSALPRTAGPRAPRSHSCGAQHHARARVGAQPRARSRGGLGGGRSGWPTRAGVWVCAGGGGRGRHRVYSHECAGGRARGWVAQAGRARARHTAEGGEIGEDWGRVREALGLGMVWGGLGGSGGGLGERSCC